MVVIFLRFVKEDEEVDMKGETKDEARALKLMRSSYHSRTPTPYFANEPASH
jgi:hypothetical protein